MKVQVTLLTPGRLYVDFLLVRYRDPSHEKAMQFEVPANALEETKNPYVHLIEESYLHADAFVRFEEPFSY